MVRRIHRYLSSERGTVVIDRLMSVAAVVHPLTAAPQVYNVYSTQDVTSVSLWTWLGFLILGLVFLAYGILHQIKPFIITQIIWFVVDFSIVVGILLYRT